MDKVSKLLAEAKPLYIKRQREKYALSSGVLSLCLACGLWLAQPAPIAFDEASFDSYFTALYLSNGSDADEIFADDVIPTDSYGLYEVI